MNFPLPTTTIVEYDNGETLDVNLKTVKYAKFDPILQQTRITFKDGEEIKVNCNILKGLKEG